MLEKALRTIEAEMARFETRRELREKACTSFGERSTMNPSLHYIDGMIDGLRYARNVVLELQVRAITKGDV